MSPSVTDPSSFHSAFHAPVLVLEVARLLRDATNVLDGTLGGGGHAQALLEQGARVTGLDRDPAAVDAASRRLSPWVARGAFHAVHASFAEVDEIPALAGARFDGILLDLGVSSRQFDDDARGFTFRRGAPLDMRMDPAARIDAASILNEAPVDELTRIFRANADEPRAPRLARQVVRRRASAPFRTSEDFVGAIRGAFGPATGPAEFAPLFQALRIAVNDELGALSRALPSLRERLTPGGVIAVISYHSGEDRLVKHAFREWSAACICPPWQPVCTCRGHPLGETVTRRAIVAGEPEMATNPRARSARLRAWRSAA
jgi:16S rRNA (cytosine1402-N4)-methyltransferase